MRIGRASFWNFCDGLMKDDDVSWRNQFTLCLRDRGYTKAVQSSWFYLWINIISFLWICIFFFYYLSTEVRTLRIHRIESPRHQWYLPIGFDQNGRKRNSSCHSLCVWDDPLINKELICLALTMKLAHMNAVLIVKEIELPRTIKHVDNLLVPQPSFKLHAIFCRS